MAYELMCDATPIAIKKSEIYELVDGVLLEHVPFGMFRNGKTEETKKVFDWVEERVVPPERVGIEDILKAMNLEKYCAWEMVKQTGGTLMTDPFWIKFSNSWSYRDHTIRGIFNFNPINPFKPFSEHREYIIPD